jgi:hypothetical protein
MGIAIKRTPRKLPRDAIAAEQLAGMVVNVCASGEAAAYESHCSAPLVAPYGSKVGRVSPRRGAARRALPRPYLRRRSDGGRDGDDDAIARRRSDPSVGASFRTV